MLYGTFEFDCDGVSSAKFLAIPSVAHRSMALGKCWIRAKQRME